jgi:hypothetical protein
VSVAAERSECGGRPRGDGQQCGGLTGRGGERVRAVRWRGMLGQQGSHVASDSGNLRRGLQIGEPVRTAPLWRARGTMAARQRMARRVAPGEASALIIGTARRERG